MADWSVDHIIYVMSEFGIDPNDVPDGCRFQEAYSFGRFKCEKCKKSWGSAFMWLRFDFREQQIVYRYHQKCEKCFVEISPTFNAENLEYMLRFLCNRYVIRNWNGGSRGRPVGNYKREFPHKSALCEKCLYGRRICYLFNGSLCSPGMGKVSFDDPTIEYSCLYPYCIGLQL